jgi:hypothetical protein
MAKSDGAPAAPHGAVPKTLKEGGTIEPVREILWGSSAGVR